MGRFPSGQREQTVNLPSQTSVVRIHPCPPLNMREWRNWQTRMIQVHVYVRTCRFKSCFPHQQQIIRTTYSSSEKGSDYLFSSQKMRSGRLHPDEGENNKRRDAIITMTSRFLYIYFLALFSCCAFHSAYSRCPSSLSKKALISGQRHLATVSIT